MKFDVSLNNPKIIDMVRLMRTAAPMMDKEAFEKHMYKHCKDDIKSADRTTFKIYLSKQIDMAWTTSETSNKNN